MRTTIAGGLALGLLLGAGLTMSGDAQAMCGCMMPVRRPQGPTEQSALTNKASVVVMMREGTRTVLAFANDYFGPAEDFALVVPVPVVLHEGDVRTLDHGVFDRVQAVAAPHMVELWEQPPCPQATPRGVGIGGMDAMMEGSGGRGMGAATQGAAPPPVVVEAQFQEGEYDITILGASDSTALERWLQNHNYRIPTGAARYLRPYVNQGMKFFVARVDIDRLRQVAQRRRQQLAAQARASRTLGQLLQGPPTQGGDASLGRFLSPLRIHYESEQFQLPVRLGLINSEGEQDLVVHILSTEGRYELANYGNRVVPTNVRVHGRAATNFGRFYDTFFGTLSARAPRRVWTEYAGPITAAPANRCVGCSRPGLSNADLNAIGGDILYNDLATQRAAVTLTRLHYRYGARGLPDDLVFRSTHPITGGFGNATDRGLQRRPQRGSQNDFRVRFVAKHRWRGAARCDNPQRGRWGVTQPWGGGSYGPNARVEWPTERPIPLGAWVRDPVPQLGIRARR